MAILQAMQRFFSIILGGNVGFTVLLKDMRSGEAGIQLSIRNCCVVYSAAATEVCQPSVVKKCSDTMQLIFVTLQGC